MAFGLAQLGDMFLYNIFNHMTEYNYTMYNKIYVITVMSDK